MKALAAQGEAPRPTSVWTWPDGWCWPAWPWWGERATPAFRCAAAARERADPAAGSAPQARRWLLLEHPGPWPVDAIAGSGIDPGVLVESGQSSSASRILLVRGGGPIGARPPLDRGRARRLDAGGDRGSGR